MPVTDAFDLQPFSVRGALGAADHVSGGALSALIDRALGLSALQRLYDDLPCDVPFWDAALAALDIRYHAAADEITNIPRTGGAIVVANHPFGAVDGLVLISLLRRVRSDARLLANYLLGRIPELRDALCPIDPYRQPGRRQANAAALRSALRWVRNGSLLAVFPAGEVAHERAGESLMADAPWSPSVAALARLAEAPVVPMLFAGGNRRVFQAAGRIHWRVRTAMLPRELLAARGRSVHVRIGSPIPSARLQSIESRDELAAYLRVRTYALGVSRPALSPSIAPDAPAGACAVAPPESPDELAAEIASFDPSQLLCRSGCLVVYAAQAQAMPRTLREIGRLREIAFRGAGEGTGRARDLDAFDDHYFHLFAWNAARREIVGAYRAAGTDRVLPRFGVAGLYTNTLFRYDLRLMQEIGPALELGRAFVRPEYQRDYGALLLLWKGIGAYVAQHPQYRMLFGPVSISNDYGSLSREILAQFLYSTRYKADLGQLVKPRNPPSFLRAGGRAAPVAGKLVRTIAEAGALLAEIEADGKGVPVLVRQYLKLNARLLGFNVDPAFGNALDGLMLVDLLEVDRDLLTRYMGKAGAHDFLAHQAPAIGRRAS